MDHYEKFIPQPTAETVDYWQGCAVGELRIQQCRDCSHIQFYPRSICAECMGAELESIVSQGTGVLISYTVVRRAVSKAYEHEVPYIVALIKLVEGPVLMSNVVDCELEEVAIGVDVEVIFEKWTDQITIPKFKLIDGS